MKHAIPILALFAATPAIASDDGHYEEKLDLCRQTIGLSAEEQLRRFRARWTRQDDVLENMVICMGYTAAKADLIKRIADAVR